MMTASLLEKLTPRYPSESSLTRVLSQLRWIVPLAFSVAGLLYVLGEALTHHEHAVPHTRTQILFSVFLLSVIGPTITYGGLSWVLGAASRLEAAEEGLRRQNRHLAILEEIVRVANRSLDPDQVLSQSLECLLRLIDLESGAIWLKQDDRLVLKVARGVSHEFPAQEQMYPGKQCLCGQVVEQGRLLTLDDLHSARDSVNGDCTCEQFEAAVGVPIRTSAGISGVLELAGRAARPFEDMEREMLITVGQQIGFAVEKAQLHRQLRELNEELESLVAARTGELMATQEELAREAARLQELLVRVRQVEEETRACIANDLHDSVRQLIVGALFEAQAIREAMRSRPENAERELDTMEGMLRSIETEMQAAIYSLRPVTLDAHGLASALHECVANLERTAGISCALQVDGTPRRLEGEVELAAFRIVQEALNNVVAHSRASRASVSVLFSAETLDIEVSDNGYGFDPSGYANGARGQLGLLGMQERAQSSGGTLRVESGNGTGTRILLTLPLEKVDTWIPYALSS